MDLASRLGLAVLWGAVAWAVLTNRRSRGGMVCAATAAALALAAALRWHAALRGALREVVGDAGLLEQRVPIKLAVVGLVAAVAVTALPRLARQPPGLRGALLFTLGWAAFLAAYTVALADHLPRALGRPPGRQVVELVFVMPALALALSWRRSGARAA